MPAKNQAMRILPLAEAKAYADLGKILLTRCGTAIRILAGDTEPVALLTILEKGGRQAEAVQDESGFYRKVSTYFFLFIPPKRMTTLSRISQERAKGSPGFLLYSASLWRVFHDASADCEKRSEFTLSSDYYKGDRSMRESGFDVSFRFGPFGAGTHHYAPVA